MIAVAGDGRERDVLRAQPCARADERGALDLLGVVERPLQRLHAAERPADRRAHALDAEVSEQRAVHGS